MRKLVGTLGVVFMMSAVLAQPAEQPKPATQPVPSTPAPATPAAQTPAPAAQPTTPAVQPAAAEPKKYEIPADAKPVNRQELEGGLIIEDFVVGTGSAVLPEGVVVANYHGTFKKDGKPFDSSWDPQFEHVQPALFGLNQVVAGWQKGLPGMREGGIRRLTVPAALGYGDRERAGGKVTIPANSDLVFVVEMLATVGAEDVKVGTGTEVGAQSVCIVAHSVKTADGKEVEKSTVENPYIVIPQENLGFDLGLKGMKVGGKRTIKVPAQLNRNPPLVDIKRPSGVPLTMEVELLNVRNLVQQQQPAVPNVQPTR